MRNFEGNGGSEKKKKLTAFAAFVILILITLLFLNSMLQGRDGRRGIVSEEGGIYEDSAKTDEEIRLENILESMEGVGKANVMIRSQTEESVSSVFLSEEDEKESGEVKGVIIVAEGADNPVISSKISEAAATVCGVPVSCVAVYSMSE